MPGGLDSLPHFFIQRPVNKICDTVCPKKAKQRRLQAASAAPDGALTNGLPLQATVIVVMVA